MLVVAAAGNPSRGPEVVVFTPGPTPVRQLAEHLTATATGIGAVSTREPETGSAVDRRTELDGARNWRLVVDRFEELYTLGGDPGQRQEFIDGLLALTRPARRTRVVVTVRGDYYGHCGARPGLAEALSSATLLVGPMTAEELREAIVRPAAEAGSSLNAS